MSPMAMGLTDKDMVDIAAYYAEQKISANELPVLDDDEDEKPAADKTGGSNAIETLIAQGSDLYRNGDLTGKSPPVSPVMALWRRQQTRGISGIKISTCRLFNKNTH